MARTETFYTRVEPKLKAEVESIFDALGMTASEAINIFLKQVVMKKGIPFEVKIPEMTYDEAWEMLMERLNRGIKDADEGRVMTLEESKSRLGLL